MPTTLNKPAGLPAFPPHGDPKGDCLLRRLLADQPWRSDVAWPRGFEGGIAHRLDNATSGAVLVADSLAELAVLREHFRGHRLAKTYLMIAARDVPWQTNQCDAPIGHHPRRTSLMVVQRGRNTPHRGRWYEGHTSFRRVGRADLGPLFEVTITTGVMHQIRVHAAFLGIPILGDRQYGGRVAAVAGTGPSRRDAASVPPSALTEAPFFLLHHVGLSGPGGFRSTSVPAPLWARLSHAAGR